MVYGFQTLATKHFNVNLNFILRDSEDTKNQFNIYMAGFDIYKVGNLGKTKLNNKHSKYSNYNYLDFKQNIM